MFNYIVEKHTIRFYKYKFLGFEDKPVIIEAYNKKEARTKLSYFIQQNIELTDIPVVDERVSLPIFGESTKNIGGVECVWVGSMTNTGWMPLIEFNSLNL